MKGAALILVVGLITVGAIAINASSIQLQLFERVVANRFDKAMQMADTLGGDYLDVVVCGSGSPIAPDTVAQACIAVFAGDAMLLFDTGARSPAKIATMGLPIERLQGIFLTHFHSDHISGLGEVHLQSWTRGREQRLKLYGPQGVERVAAGFNEAFALDYGYRVAHHGADLLSPDAAGFSPVVFATPTSDQKMNSVEVLSLPNGLRVSAFAVDHDPIAPAVGYTVEYKNRRVVISGDTVITSSLEQQAHQADLLLHEALHFELVDKMSKQLPQDGVGQLLADTLDYHASPEQVAKLAERAQVKNVALYHTVPSPNNFVVEQLFMREALQVNKDVILAKDGYWLRLSTTDLNSPLVLESLL